MFLLNGVISKKDQREIKEISYISIEKFYLDSIINNILVEPSSLPMICEPLEWNENSYGGFLSNAKDKIDITTGSIDRPNHMIENKETLYKTINLLNRIKFRINNDLLDYLTGPGQFLIDKDDSQQLITISIAKFYKDTYFYLNTHSDWRGRIFFFFCRYPLILYLLSMFLSFI